MPVQKLQRDRLGQITLSSKDAWISEADYLKTIDELLSWFPKEGPTINSPRTKSLQKGAEVVDIPKLLVCHDFGGNYTENLFERGYSFEFWHLIDTFIYFSHNRVTLPPRGWIEAGHRRGVKVLGTLIFEWEESKSDLCKCLYQGTPYTPSNSGQPYFALDSAVKLIQLAQEHNFDGYLLNIETDLNFLPPEEFYLGGKEEKQRDEEALMNEKKLAGMKMILDPGLRKIRMDRMRKNAFTLESWTAYIRNEGKRLVGPHFEIIWYDSVTIAGKLEWQDALTPLNAPFFLAADNIFTNYTWASPPSPTPPGSFPSTPKKTYHSKLLQSSDTAKILNRLPSTVFEGIDVFGRNCYGGFDVSKSLDLIFPPSLPPLGLSVAIFAPGWTWERAKDDGTERSWTEWWNDDVRLWVGPTTSNNSNSHIRPVGAYFGSRQRSRIGGEPIMDICQVPFYTNFSRGSGNAWWMLGRKVYDTSVLTDQLGRCGWTDIGASFPLPDRLWPQPRILCALSNEDEGCSLVDVIPNDNDSTMKDVILDELDAWEGSTCLKFTVIPNNSPIPFFIMPLCTLQESNVAAGEVFITLVVKILGPSKERLTILPQILWANDKPHETSSFTLSGSSRILSQSHIVKGWYRIEAVVIVQPSIDASFMTPVVGLQITLTGWDMTLQTYPIIHCLIGSITILPINWPLRKMPSSQLGSMAYWRPLNSPSSALWGVLSWDTDGQYRDFGYFNIVVSVVPNLDIGSAEEDKYFWLGSSTAEKHWNSFVVCGLDLTEIPNYNVSITETITFYIIHVGIPSEMSLYKLTMKIRTK